MSGENFIEILDDQEESPTPDRQRDTDAAMHNRIHRLEQKLEETSNRFDRIMNGVNYKFDQIITMLQ